MFLTSSRLKWKYSTIEKYLILPTVGLDKMTEILSKTFAPAYQTNKLSFTNHTSKNLNYKLSLRTSWRQ